MVLTLDKKTYIEQARYALAWAKGLNAAKRIATSKLELHRYDSLVPRELISILSAVIYERLVPSVTIEKGKILRPLKVFVGLAGAWVLCEKFTDDGAHEGLTEMLDNLVADYRQVSKPTGFYRMYFDIERTPRRHDCDSEPYLVINGLVDAYKGT